MTEHISHALEKGPMCNELLGTLDYLDCRSFVSAVDMNNKFIM